MKYSKYILLLAILIPLLSAGPLRAQDEDPHIIINSKLFSRNNHWLTIGTGYGLYAEKQTIQSNFGADIHFKIKDHYFSGGYLYSGQHFITKSYALQVNDLHLGYGWRKERLKSNRYFFIGPSLAMGYEFSRIDSLSRIWDVGFIDPGFYTELQYTYKFNYDMGLGLAAFASVCPSYQVVGLKAIVYLSTAYIKTIEEDKF